jgi:hypothetical protein
MVQAWESLVEQLEEGYDEYWNDLSIRDSIEVVLADPRLAAYAQLAEIGRSASTLERKSGRPAARAEGGVLRASLPPAGPGVPHELPLPKAVSSST